MKLSLAVQFWRWIVGGLAILIIAISLASKTICVAPVLEADNHNQSTDQANYRTNALTHLLDESTSRRIALVEPNQPKTANHSEQSDKNISEFARPVICDAKITDIGIMFFTYCLVVVGWFGIRSTEQNTEAIERSYLFFGYSPPKFRNGHVNFQLVVTNTGRCPGIMKEIGYAFLQRESLPHSRKQANWPWRKIEYDWATPSTIRRDIGMVHGPTGDCFFVCYINYQDMFTKRDHTSWMGMRIRPDAIEERERVTRAGDAWNDWD